MTRAASDRWGEGWRGLSVCVFVMTGRENMEH